MYIFLLIAFVIAKDAASTYSQGVLTIDGLPDFEKSIVSCSFGTLTKKPGRVYKLNKASPILACDEINSVESGSIVLVERGICAFSKKTCNAENAGASAVLVFNNEEGKGAITMGGKLDESCNPIPACSISYDTGAKLIEVLASGTTVEMTLYNHENPLFDPVMMVIWCWACGVVFFGAWFSAKGASITSRNRSGATGNSEEDEQVQVLTVSQSIMFLILSSTMLLILYFFIHRLVYFLFFMYAMGTEHAMVHLTSCFLNPRFPTKTIRFRILGQRIETRFLTLLLHLFYIGLVIFWFVTRKSDYAWVLQNLMGAALCVRMQELIKLPNLRVATYLLCAFFFYDVFFVFITPYIFQKSVMMEVGTGGSTGEKMPMVFSFPRFYDEFGGYSMLGLGDVAFPGFLVSYCRNYDMMHSYGSSNGYFYPCFIGYGVGLCITMGVLVVFQSGQPALLYLVPCTLGTVLFLSNMRDEFDHLWCDNDQNKYEYVATHDDHDLNDLSPKEPED